ncbi:MAG: hypothetical protein FWD58_06965 [Firmicutes bacterium]|nr:hypothetical protein [Bacillota bacterium]
MRKLLLVILIAYFYIRRIPAAADKKNNAACGKKSVQKDWAEQFVVDKTVEKLFKHPRLLQAKTPS